MIPRTLRCVQFVKICGALERPVAPSTNIAPPANGHDSRLLHDCTTKFFYAEFEAKKRLISWGVYKSALHKLENIESGIRATVCGTIAIVWSGRGTGVALKLRSYFESKNWQRAPCFYISLPLHQCFRSGINRFDVFSAH
jgi:hypothetical protein